MGFGLWLCGGGCGFVMGIWLDLVEFFFLSCVLGCGGCGGCVVVVDWWPLVHLGSCVLY